MKEIKTTVIYRAPEKLATKGARDHRGIKGNERLIEKLVAAAKVGDSESFAHVYDLTVDAIYRYIYYRVSEDDVEDLTELVYLKAWENLSRYKEQQNKFSAWLFRIAHNIVVDHYRVSRKHAELDEQLVDKRKEADASYDAEQTLNKKTLRGAMSKLKDSYQEILILKFMEDLSNREIADLTGKQESTLRILQFRALKALKKELDKMGIGEF